MKIKAAFENKKVFVPTPFEPGIWVFLLWHTGKDLPGHISFTRGRRVLQNVYIENSPLHKAFSLPELRGYAEVSRGAFYQEDNKVYIKLRHDSEAAAYMSAQEWLFLFKIFSDSVFITDGYFHVPDGNAAKYGILSGYKMKISADTNSYSQIKFNTLSLSFIWDKIKDLSAGLIGSNLVLSTLDDNQQWERLAIENITRGIDTAELSLKDIRSALSFLVIDQQYDRAGYLNGNGHIIMSEDVGKEYKKDAIGYCTGVPGDCINGYAFDTDMVRRYRASYNKITVDLFNNDLNSSVIIYQAANQSHSQ